MKKKSVMLVVTLSAVIAAACFIMSPNAEARGANNPHPQPVIYVTSQGLYYDSIVTADPLPPQGKFQELYVGPNGLSTEFGPGDDGYLGGRWVLDPNGSPHFFSCPLMGPGRETP
jgi:hypothetical protein